ncbi:MAG TPA: hypothetical protein DEA08_10235 [Planctomycetes bacterium]|nr:hypothetical protein [Planctomycetota bacterium]
MEPGERTEPPEPTPPDALAALQRAALALCAWFERLAAGERWLLKTALAATLLALLCSFPRPAATTQIGSAPEWEPLREQIAQPLSPREHDPAGHAAKTAFRLVAPGLAHLLGLGPAGLKLFEALCGVLLFALVALAAERTSGERRAAVLVTLLVASCFMGISAFVEHRGFFDAVALLGLALACAWRNPAAVLVGVSLACWTDERGALAAGLVALLHFVEAPAERGVKRVADPCCLAVALALGLYAGGRAWLGARYGLHTPLAGTGARYLVNQLNNLPLGLWTGLEGGWLLVLAAGLALWRAGRRALLLGAILAGGLVIGAAFSVWDITRSLIYLLPCLFLGLRVLREHEPAPARLTLCRVAFVLSLLWPNLYAAGKGEVSWNYPLPLMALKYFES